MRTCFFCLAMCLLWACEDSDFANAVPGGRQPDSTVAIEPDAATIADAATQSDARIADASVPDAAVPDAGAPVQQRWWHDDVFYEIFVRSFQDSDGDGVGDINGLISRLDALNDGDPSTDTDLGITGLWLMPIHPSPSYHGYDVTDYRGINPDYGTMADFERLLDEAHARGISVVIDLVVNHSSAQHPWFIDARTGEEAEHRDWYVWRRTDPRWQAPFGLGPTLWHGAPGGWLYYGVFWSGMPDLNHRNEAVYAEMLDTAREWLDRGVDGFRFDAVRYLIETEDGELADIDETHDWFKRLRADLDATHPEALLLAEAWSNTEKVAAYYGDDDELHLAFNFDLSQAIQQATITGDASGLRFTLDSARRTFATRRFEAPFITNHDMNRLMRDNRVGVPEFKVAMALLMGLPGTPFLYYGEEIGMEGGPLEADEDKRTPMRWTPDDPHFGFTDGTPWRSRSEDEGVDVATQRDDPTSLWSHTRDLIALRSSDLLWSLGDTMRLDTPSKGVVALMRTYEGRRGIVAVNFDRTDIDVPIEIELPAPAEGLLVQAFSPDASVRLDGDRLIINGLGALGWIYLQLQ
ncbi:MAG: alpha-amylase family glycosyl hydrolase [Bradymonadia bacterium]